MCVNLRKFKYFDLFNFAATHSPKAPKSDLQQLRWIDHNSVEAKSQWGAGLQVGF
jgi:hypothetical protein